MSVERISVQRSLTDTASHIPQDHGMRWPGTELCSVARSRIGRFATRTHELYVVGMEVVDGYTGALTLFTTF